ncbi:MAG: dihydrofolate reductase [Halieaceae bacterium]|jgi:dihydrofolate reductase
MLEIELVLSLIYARSLDHCIGDQGRVPWHLPNEFAHFESTTMNKPIIMGRKTYEDHYSVLPGRFNIVVSTQRGYKAIDGVTVVPSLSDAIKLAKTQDTEVFVIGGVNFFAAALPYATHVYETVIEAKIGGDTVLPTFDFNHWNTKLLIDHPIDDQHEFAFRSYRHSRNGGR